MPFLVRQTFLIKSRTRRDQRFLMHVGTRDKGSAPLPPAWVEGLTTAHYDFYRDV